jgi:hypothetical protein
VVTFVPDGHRSVFRRDWLAAQALAAQGGAVADPRTEDGKVLWRAADLAAPHTADWAAYTSDDRMRENCLDPDNLAFTSREIAPHTDNLCHSAC